MKITTVAVFAVTTLFAIGVAAPLRAGDEQTASAPAVDLSDGLTLDEAATLALSENPRIRLAQSGEAIAVARLRQAQSTWLPQVTVSETFMRGNNPVFVFGSLLEQGNFGPANFDPAFLNDPPNLDNYRLALSARMAIFDQLRRGSMISQAGDGVDQSKIQADMTRQMLRYYTVRTYYGALVAAASEQVAANAVKTADSNVAAIRDRFETGLVVESDLLAAEVQLSNFKEQLIQAQGQKAIAEKALANVMGLPPGTAFRISGELVPTTFAERSYEDIITEGMKTRHDVRMAALGRHAAALGARIAKGQFLPRVDAFGTWGASGATISEHNDDKVYGVMASWNVLDPGRISRVSEARAAELAAQAQNDQVTSDAELDILTAYQKYLAAKQRVDVGERSAARAEAALHIVNDRYNEGLTTITELLGAQTSMTGAQLARLGSLYEYYTGYADLLRATGTLDTIEMFSRPRDASTPAGETPASPAPQAPTTTPGSAPGTQNSALGTSKE